MEPPSKRPRTGPASYDGDSSDSDGVVAEDELSMNPVQFDIEQDPLYELDRGRANAATRLRSRFESIFAKYEKDFTGIGDEIDFHTGEVVVDNGHIETILQDEDDYDDDDSSASDTDQDVSGDEADGFVPGSALPEPENTASDIHKNHWALPEDLPNLDGHNPLGLSASGFTQAVVPQSAFQGASMPNAAPLLNPALLQYDSFGQARMRRSLSDMLSRYSHSRLTNAKSFMQAQKSTTTLGVGSHAASGTNSLASSVRTTNGPLSHVARQIGGYGQPYHKSGQRPLAEKASANLAKKVKELRKKRNNAKSKEFESAKGATKFDTAVGPAQDGGVVVKRKRGRPRKVRPVEVDEATQSSQTLPAPEPLCTTAPNTVGQMHPQSKVGRRGPGRPRKHEAGLAVVSKSLPDKGPHRKSLALRRRKPVGSAKRLGPKSSAKRKQLRTDVNSLRKSARERKQTEFYGELISTLEIEQSLLESDDDDASGVLRSIHGIAMAHLLNGREAGECGGEEQDEDDGDDEDEGDEGEEVQGSRELSPDLSSQRTVRDSQEPVSSLPVSNGTPTASYEKRLPFRAARQIVRDSQDPSSSIPIPECSPNVATQSMGEVFRRNEVDPTYGFSDDDEVVDRGIQHRLPVTDDLSKPLPPKTAEVILTDSLEDIRATPKVLLDIAKSILPDTDHAPNDRPLQADAHDVTLLEVTEDGTPMYGISSPESKSRSTPKSPAVFVANLSLPVEESLFAETDPHHTPMAGVSSPVIPSDEPLAPLTPPRTDTFSEPLMASTKPTESVALESPDLGVNSTPTRRYEQHNPSLPALDLSTGSPPVDDSLGSATFEEKVKPPVVVEQIASGVRSSSLTATGSKDEPRTPRGHRTQEIKVKTASTFKRRVLALSNLVPDPSAVDGDEDELSTTAMSVHRPYQNITGSISRPGLANRHRSSTPRGQLDARDDPRSSTSRRSSTRVSGVAGVVGEDNTFAPSITDISDAKHADKAIASRRRKTGFGFENARGTVPHASSAMQRLVPPTKTPTSNLKFTTSTRSTSVMSNKPDIQPALGSSPSKTGQISPLAKRMLAQGNTTPQNRKRRRQTDTQVVNGDDDDSSAGELVQTPGGTLRRCGVGGFTCDRDFCMVCCI